jgi:hypothetical protein
MQFSKKNLPGKSSFAGKTPPSKHVPSGPVIRASHSKKFSSLIGPAIIPSGGFKVSSGRF